jgi:hypothetical protein
MPADTPQIPARSGRNGRGKLRLLSRDALDGRTKAAQVFDRLVGAIEVDLGGRSALSTIERALIEGFAGSCVVLGHLNAKLALGEDIEVSEHAQAVSAMVRVAGRLGLQRRMIDKTPPPIPAAYFEHKRKLKEAAS